MLEVVNREAVLGWRWLMEGRYWGGIGVEWLNRGAVLGWSG